MATAAQIAEIRLISGDDITGDYAVDDTTLGTWYDDSSSICGTAYKVARARLAKASKTIGASGEGQTVNPKVGQIRELLQFLRDDCPDALPAGNIISVNLGIDEEIDLFDIE